MLLIVGTIIVLSLTALFVLATASSLRQPSSAAPRTELLYTWGGPPQSHRYGKPAVSRYI